MRFEYLFAEFGTLYGDAANMSYLHRAVPDAEIVKTRHTDCPAFVDSHVDFVYIGSLTEAAQELAIAALLPHRESLERYINRGGVFLATGNSLEIFGEYIQNIEDRKQDKKWDEKWDREQNREQNEKRRIPGLGLFSIHAERDMINRYNSLFLGKFFEEFPEAFPEGFPEAFPRKTESLDTVKFKSLDISGSKSLDIVGFKSQFGHCRGDNGEGLFTTTRGAGLNPDVVPEGLRRNNFMATYLLGPLLVLNPPFTKYLLGLLGYPNATLPFEAATMDLYKARVREFSDPKRGFTY